MKQLSVDLNLTDACTFRCKYCYERDSGYFATKMKQSDVELACNFVDKFIETEYFKSKFSHVTVNFWGGEPTLNSDAIEYVVDRFKNNPIVGFYLISNGGSSFDSVLPLIYDLKDSKTGSGEDKFKTQISYDGQKTHSEFRLSSFRKSTADIVRKRIDDLINMDIPFSLKATLPLEHLSYIYENYSDFKSINLNNEEKLKKCKNTKSLGYYPTIDYTSDLADISPEIFEAFKESLLKIAKDEIELAKAKHLRIFQLIAETNRKTCTAGNGFFFVNSDLDIYPCHGCLYSENKDALKWGNLDTDFSQLTDLFINKFREFEESFNTPACNCWATVCLACNAAKFDKSTKSSFFERWNDFSCQPLLCKLYKELSKVAIAIDRKL